MQASLSEALPLTATPKGVIQKWATKLALIYVKAPRLKKQCHSLPYSVLRIRNDQYMHFKFGFSPDSNPKMGKKGVTKLLFIYLKQPRLKALTWRTLGFSECGLTNSSILSLTLPLTATQKGVIKWGNKIDIYLCKKKAKTSVISYLLVPEYGMTNGSNLRVAFTLDRTPKMGKKG